MLERVTCFPNEGTPQVIPGDPVDGDIVRITTPSGTVIYQHYVSPSAPARTLDQASQARAIVLGRAARLDKKGQHLEAIALRATIGA